MSKTRSSYSFALVVVIGAVWGLSETAMGLGLKTCARLISGSVMTGVTLFFMAAAWAVTRSFWSIALLILIASLFKLLDAVLLGLPVKHGAIGNPLFAFVLEGLFFALLILFLSGAVRSTRKGQAVWGGAPAFLAAGAFPLVGFATGVSACVFPGTALPLSVVFAPLAGALSAILVPLGILSGSRLQTRIASLRSIPDVKLINGILSPAALALCLALAALNRLV